MFGGFLFIYLFLLNNSWASKYSPFLDPQCLNPKITEMPDSAMDVWHFLVSLTILNEES